MQIKAEHSVLFYDERVKCSWEVKIESIGEARTLRDVDKVYEY